MAQRKAKPEQGFSFFECVSLIQPTGKQAGSLEELLALLKEVEPSVIYHHTHQYYLKASVEAPEYPTDFAAWAAEGLGERALAEKLACVDLYSLNDLEAIRGALVQTVEDYLKAFPSPGPCLPGWEFFFNKSVTVVVPTGREVYTLKEFCTTLKDVGTSSIYYHFFESRLRLAQAVDDISRWLAEGLGRHDLSREVRAVDPYFYSLEDLRVELLEILCRDGGREKGVR